MCEEISFLQKRLEYKIPLTILTEFYFYLLQNIDIFIEDNSLARFAGNL